MKLLYYKLLSEMFYPINKNISYKYQWKVIGLRTIALEKKEDIIFILILKIK